MRSVHATETTSATILRGGRDENRIRFSRGAGSTSTNTWETKYVNGHLVTGDMARGIDVLKVL